MCRRARCTQGSRVLWTSIPGSAWQQYSFPLQAFLVWVLPCSAPSVHCRQGLRALCPRDSWPHRLLQEIPETAGAFRGLLLIGRAFAALSSGVRDSFETVCTTAATVRHCSITPHSLTLLIWMLVLAQALLVGGRG